MLARLRRFLPLAGASGCAASLARGAAHWCEKTRHAPGPGDSRRRSTESGSRIYLKKIQRHRRRERSDPFRGKTPRRGPKKKNPAARRESSHLLAQPPLHPPMFSPPLFQVVVIRKDGEDGGRLPLEAGDFTFGWYESRTRRSRARPSERHAATRAARFASRPSLFRGSRSFTPRSPSAPRSGPPSPT